LWNKYKNVWKKSVILLCWLVIWEVAALWIHNRFLLVTPVVALKTLLQDACTLLFWKSVGISFLRIAGGFFLALLLGIFIAGISYRRKAVGEFLSPMLQLLKAIPMVSFVVLLLIWWGANWLPFAISFLVSFTSIAITTKEGLEGTTKQQREVFGLYRIPFWTKLFYLYRYSVGPYLRTTLKTTVGTCFRAGVAAEVIGMVDDSMGGAIYFSKISFDTGELFAWTFVIVVLSYGFERSVLWLFEKYMEADVPCRKMELGETAKDVVIQQANKAFGENTVLTDFTQTYTRDMLHWLTWESGKGKTTLFRCIAGLECLDTGSILAGDSVSMMFQEDRLLLTQSALKNVELVCQNKELIQEHLLQLLPKECLTLPVEKLSGGMKRRVALVRAMLAKGDVVLLDEPFTGMDQETVRKAMEYIEANKRGRAVLIATHIKTEVDE